MPLIKCLGRIRDEVDGNAPGVDSAGRREAYTTVTESDRWNHTGVLMPRTLSESAEATTVSMMGTLKASTESR